MKKIITKMPTWAIMTLTILMCVGMSICDTKVDLEFSKIPNLLFAGSFDTTTIINIGIMLLASSILTSSWMVLKKALFNRTMNISDLKVIKKTFKSDITYLMSLHSGALASKISQYSALVTEGFALLIQTPLIIIPLIVMMVKLSTTVGIQALIINIVMMAVSVIITYIICKIFKTDRSRNAVNTLKGVIADNMANMKTLRYLGKEKFAIDRLQSAQKTAEHDCILIGRQFALGLTDLVISIPTIINLLMLKGHDDVVELAMFIMLCSGYYQRAVGLILNAVDIITQLHDVKKDLAGLDTEDTRPVKPLGNGIDLSNITFGYEESDVIFKTGDMKIETGHRYCITGESGQGKSSLANLLAGVLKPINGYVPRVPVYYIYQETECLDMSLRDNICLGEDITDIHIMNLLGLLGLGPWIESLPDGLDTLLGERGTKVSSGQKQRINIARAILRMEKMDVNELIIMDEPTSNLDDETEKLVCRVIDEVCKNTLIVITHRPAISQICDHHIVVENHIFREV